MEKTVIGYKLFALHPTKKNIEYAKQRRFHKISSDYILIYDGEMPKNALEISYDDFSCLSASDKEWLGLCNLTIINEFVEKHEDERKESFKNFMKELEHNIKEELSADKESDKAKE